MLDDINKLLNKNKLTATEVGRAFIKACLKQGLSKELILTDKQLQVLFSKLTDKSEIEIGKAYVNLNTWIHRYNYWIQAYYQQFYVGYSILFFRITYSLNAEQGLVNLQKLTADIKKTPDCKKLKEFTEQTLSSFSFFVYKDSQVDIEFTKDGVDYIKRGLIEILSYNKALDLISGFLKLPEFATTFKIEVKSLFTAINSLNDKIIKLKKLLTQNGKEFEEKIAFLDQVCPPFDILCYEPTIDAINKAKSSLEENILQNNPSKIIRVLKQAS